MEAAWMVDAISIGAEAILMRCFKQTIQGRLI